MGRLSWISQVGPKYSHPYTSKGEEKGDLIHTQRRKQCEDGPEGVSHWPGKLEGCGYEPRNVSNHQKLGEVKNRFSSKASRGSMALLASLQVLSFL